MAAHSAIQNPKSKIQNRADVLIIRGRAPLAGFVEAAGAKNAALPIMAACLLADARVVLERVPQVTDVDTLALLLGYLGVEVKRASDGCVHVETVDRRAIEAPAYLIARFRAGICVLGPLLARRRCAVVPLPGGCAIGRRPIDVHLRGLTALGAEIQTSRGAVVARARALVGAKIDLAGPHGSSVTGTANVLMAATLARGESILTGAAVEPEIVDLGRFLTALGARIDGLGTSTLRVRGVDQLGGARHCVIGDRIEAATLLLAAAITGGGVTVTGIEHQSLRATVDKLVDVGCDVSCSARAITVVRRAPLAGASITATPFPGVATDTQALWTATLAIARGTSHVADQVFPDRFRHLDALSRFGAVLEPTAGGVRIDGVPRLRAATVEAADLRACAALVLAALAAQGCSIIHGVDHLDRGYERLEQKLAALGAHIKRTAAPALFRATALQRAV